MTPIITNMLTRDRKAGTVSDMAKRNGKLTAEEIGEKIRHLKVGKTFRVHSDRERRDALQAAKFTGKRIVTKKAKKGFTITALPV